MEWGGGGKEEDEEEKKERRGGRRWRGVEVGVGEKVRKKKRSSGCLQYIA
jgi:hypothetical protein